MDIHTGMGGQNGRVWTEGRREMWSKASLSVDIRDISTLVELYQYVVLYCRDYVIMISSIAVG